MRGILWRWLLIFGFLLWVSLCALEHYRNVYGEVFEEVEEWKINEEQLKKDTTPPALTFWKTLSMILSVTGLIFMKRASVYRRLTTTIHMPTKTNTSIDAPINTKTNNTDLSTLPARINYYKELRNRHFLSTSKNIFTNPRLSEKSAPIPLKKTSQTITNPLRVEMVQKKLENLEKSVASLKKRCSIPRDDFRSSLGVVSNSMAFKKFLEEASVANKKPSESISNTSLSSQVTENIKVSGLGLISTSEELSKNKPELVFSQEPELPETKETNNVSNSTSSSFRVTVSTPSAESDSKDDAVAIKSSLEIENETVACSKESEFIPTPSDKTISAQSLSSKNDMPSVTSLFTHKSMNSESETSEESHIPFGMYFSSSDYSTSGSFPTLNYNHKRQELFLGDDIIDELD